MMRYRWLALAGWFVTAIVLGLSVASRTASQGRPPEGAFLTASDGSRWAVGNGARVRLSFATDDTNALATLRDAGSASTLTEAQAALGGGATPVAATAPSTPADTLLGHQLTACAEQGGTPFAVTVVQTDWQHTVAGTSARGNALWAIVVLNITNLGAVDTGPYRGATPAVRLIDERNRPFETDFFGAHYDLHVALVDAYGADAPFFAPLRSGITERRVLAFELPPDVQRLTLVSEAPC